MPTSSRRYGLLTQAAFMAATSSPTDSSPMLRGRMVQQDFLCRPIPDPPANLMARLGEPMANEPGAKRKRLAVHRENPACATCHNLIDPPGLALENYDAIGGYRAKDHGEVIDASGSLDNAAFADAEGFVKALAAHPDVSACLVRKFYRYALGRSDTASEEADITHFAWAFEAGGRKVPALWAQIVSSDAFTHISTVQDMEIRK